MTTLPARPTSPAHEPGRHTPPLSGLRPVNCGGLACLALALTLLPVTANEWPPGKNRFSLNTHIGFNIKTDFTRLGGESWPEPTAPTPPPDPDSLPLNNSAFDHRLRPHNSSSTSAPSISNVDDAPYWGVELTYVRELGWNRSYWWGIELGMSWVNLNVAERGSFAMDSAATGELARFNTVSLAPSGIRGVHSHSPHQVGTTTSLTGSYELDAHLYALRLGLFYETPFTDWFTLQFGGGVVGAFVESDFSYHETLTVTGSEPVVSSSSSRDTDFLGGAYARIGFGFRFTSNFHSSVGLQYNYLGTFSQNLDGRRADIDLKNSLFLAIGVGVAF